MIILGIDPGTAICGYGLVEKENYKLKALDCGTVNTPAGTPIHTRLMMIYEGITKLIDEYQPEECAVEELFFNQNARTVIPVGEARGVIILAAAHRGVPVYEYTPLQVKQAVVGYGRADKKQVQYMVKTLLNLAEVPKPDDAADALAVAICHGNSRIIRVEQEKTEQAKSKNRVKREPGTEAGK